MSCSKIHDSVQAVILKSELPIYKRAETLKVIEACFEFVDSVESLCGDWQIQKSAALETRNTLQDFLHSAENTKSFSPLKAARISVACEDLCILDEMRYGNSVADIFQKEFAFSDKAGAYHRFFGRDQHLPEMIVDKLSSIYKTPVINIIFAGKEHISSRYNGTGYSGMLTDKIAYWLNASVTSEGILISRQMLFTELLLCGINPLRDYKTSYKQNNRVKDFDVKASGRIRRLKHSLKLMEKLPEDVEQPCMKRSCIHWMNLLSENSSMYEDIILTSSGFSANEAVSGVVSEIADTTCYQHPYWYFENRPSIQDYFCRNLISESKNAEIVFLSYEPISPSDLDLYQDSEIPDVSDVVKDISEMAEKHNDRDFYIVYDVSQAPLLNILKEYKFKCPENLILIKTSSLSKWQKGRRNHFFGIVSLHGCNREKVKNIKKKILDSLPFYDASPDVFQLLNWPRPGRRYLQDCWNNIAETCHIINEQAVLPEGWQIKCQSMHMFLAPPRKLIDKIDELSIFLARKYSHNHAQNYLTFKLASNLDKEIYNKLSPEHRKYIEPGNSYALKKHRYVYVPDGPSMGSYRSVIGCIRISPGFESPASILLEALNTICKAFTETLQKASNAMEKEFIANGLEKARHYPGNHALLNNCSDEELYIQGRFDIQKGQPAHSFLNHYQSDSVRRLLQYLERPAKEEFEGHPRLIFDLKAIRKKMHRISEAGKAFGVKFLYAVKSGPFPEIIELAGQHLEGFDVSNLKELSLVSNLHREIKPDVISFTGPMLKADEDLKNYGDIKIVRVLEDLIQIEKLNSENCSNHLALRINAPDYLHCFRGDNTCGLPISRFGIKVGEIRRFLYALKDKGQLSGLHVHHGSEINDPEYFIRAARSLLNIYNDFRGAFRKENCYINLGGGLHNIPEEELTKLFAELRRFIPDELEIYFEPGRLWSEGFGYAVTRIIRSTRETIHETKLTLNISSQCHLQWDNPSLLCTARKAGRTAAPVINCYGPTCYESDHVGMFVPTGKKGYGIRTDDDDTLIFCGLSLYAAAWNRGFNGVEPAVIEFM